MSSKWAYHWSEHARLISMMSPCPRGRVGAVIVDDRNNPVSMGFNGAPRGGGLLCGHNVCNREANKVVSGTSTEVGCHHAEANALMNAVAIGISTRGCSLIVTRAPCLMCSKLIHHSGITSVFISEVREYTTNNGLSYLNEAGISVVHL